MLNPLSRRLEIKLLVLVLSNILIIAAGGKSINAQQLQSQDMSPYEQREQQRQRQQLPSTPLQQLRQRQQQRMDELWRQQQGRDRTQLEERQYQQRVRQQQQLTPLQQLRQRQQQRIDEQRRQQ